MYQNNIYIDNYEELSVPYRNLLIKNSFLDAE